MDPRIARLKSTTFCGQRFTRKQIASILDVVETFPLLSRSELALTVCEQLRLQTPSGNNRLRTALNTLAELQDLGLLTLPPPRKQGGRGPQKPIKPSSRTAPQPAVEGPLAALGPVRLALAEGRGQVREWNAWVDRYHPLGYRQPIGAHLRYFVLDGQGRKLGCLLFDFAVRKVACRDEWIGWAGQKYRKHLKLVVRNARFLLFPWVGVKNLASHVLGLAARQVAAAARGRAHGGAGALPADVGARAGRRGARDERVGPRMDAAPAAAQHPAGGAVRLPAGARAPQPGLRGDGDRVVGPVPPARHPAAAVPAGFARRPEPRAGQDPPASVLARPPRRPAARAARRPARAVARPSRLRRRRLQAEPAPPAGPRRLPPALRDRALSPRLAQLPFILGRVSRRAHPSQRLDRTLPQPQGAHAPAAAGNQNPPCHRAGRPPGGPGLAPPAGGGSDRPAAWVLGTVVQLGWPAATIPARPGRKRGYRPVSHKTHMIGPALTPTA